MTVVDLLDQGARLGLHRGAQVAVLKGDRTARLYASGWDSTQSSVDDSTRFPYTCASKIFGSLTVAILTSQKRLDCADKLGNYLPEAAGSPIADITVAQLLTHTSGIVTDLGDEVALLGRDEMLRALIHAQPPAPQGGSTTIAQYSIWANWFLLSLVVEAVTATLYSDVVRACVLEPLGLTTVVSRWDEAAPHRSVRFEIGRGAGAATVKYDSEPYAGTCLPGYSYYGSAQDLAVALAALGTSQRAAAIGIAPEVRLAFTQTLRTGLVDHSLGWAAEWGLGLMTDRRGLHWKGGASVCGHLGAGASTLAVLDPGADITVALTFGRAPSPLASTARAAAVLDQAVRDAD